VPGLVNLVVAERSLATTSAKASQPNDDLHGDRLTLSRRHDRPSEKTCLAVLVGWRGRPNIGGPRRALKAYISAQTAACFPVAPVRNDTQVRPAWLVGGVAGGLQGYMHAADRSQARSTANRLRSANEQ
jgi:hypothetical protein